MVRWLKCLNHGFWTPEFLVTVSNIKVDIFSYNKNEETYVAGGVQWNRVLAGFRKSAPGLKQKSIKSILKNVIYAKTIYDCSIFLHIKYSLSVS